MGHKQDSCLGVAKEDSIHRINLNIMLAGRVQKTNNVPMKSLGQIKFFLGIVSTAVFGYGHYNIKSNKSSEMANTTAPKSKNCQHTLKNCSKL